MTEHNETGVAGTPSNEADIILAPTVAALMGITYNTFRSYRANARGQTPPPLGKRASNYLWSMKQVEAWLAARSERG
ncbi:MAG: hypothetical protein Q8R82_07070 [Hyphomonadaceae bacterium]|nr:hypothetical protein [Hyphomonadaceae bacterium]